MARPKHLYVLLCVSLALVQSFDVPVPICRSSDSGCLKSSFQRMVKTFMSGIPELEVDPLDEMPLEDLAFDLAGLQFTLKGGRFQGLKKSVIDNVKWDADNREMMHKFHFDGVLRGNYTAAGKLLILPITGDGLIQILFKNIDVETKVIFEITEANGKGYYKLKAYSYDVQVKDNAQYSLTNLFNGNKQLSDTMLKFINENWKEVTPTFQDPIVKVVIRNIMKGVKKFMEKLPLQDILLI